MVRVTQDNEPLSFITLSAATRNVTRYLGLDEKKDEPKDECSSSREEQQRVLEQLEFVKLRLRDLGRFEDRARGKKRI